STDPFSRRECSTRSTPLRTRCRSILPTCRRRTTRLTISVIRNSLPGHAPIRSITSRAYFTGGFLPYCFLETVYVPLVFLAADLESVARHHPTGVRYQYLHLANCSVRADLFALLVLVVGGAL